MCFLFCYFVYLFIFISVLVILVHQVKLNERLPWQSAEILNKYLYLYTQHMVKLLATLGKYDQIRLVEKLMHFNLYFLSHKSNLSLENIIKN